ncbi:MAG: hypothetical protein ACP5H2_00785 [Solirubrobacteraceae bacterium]
MRKVILAALITSAAVAGCGSTPHAYYDTVPVTFSATLTTPTGTTPAPVNKAYLGPEGLPVETGPFLASPLTSTLGPVVDGIQCQPMAQHAYTAYAHLQVYVNGHPRTLPGGIGLVNEVPRLTAQGFVYRASTCMYWLHTRADDGVIQIQSPVPRRFTLGDLFRIWNQPLTRNRIADARGHLTVTLNGKHWNAPPGGVPLREHAVIQIDVGTPVVRFQPVSWLGTGL